MSVKGSIILKEQDREKLANIVHKMEQNKEPENAIRAVVDAFKGKYGIKKKDGGSDTASPTKSPSNSNVISQEDLKKFQGAKPTPIEQQKMAPTPPKTETPPTKTESVPPIPKEDYSKPGRVSAASESTSTKVDPSVKQQAKDYKYHGTVGENFNLEVSIADHHIDEELQGNDHKYEHFIRQGRSDSFTMDDLKKQYQQKGWKLSPGEEDRLLKEEKRKRFEAPVTPLDVSDARTGVVLDDNASRKFLNDLSKDNPRLQKSLYLNDISKDIYQDKENASNRSVKAYTNAQKVGSGDLNYDAEQKMLIKKENFGQSFLTGWKNKSQEFHDYDFLKHTDNDAAIAAELDFRKTHSDPDEPTPVPANMVAGLAQTVGEMPTKALLASAAAGVAGPEASVAAGAVVGALESGKMAYAGEFKRAYYEMRDAGVEPFEAVRKARSLAEDASEIGKVTGLAMGVIGGRVGAKLPTPVFSQGFRQAATSAMRTTGVELNNIVAEGLTAGGIAGAGETYKNALARQAGIQRDLNEGVGQAIEDNLLFSAGMSIFTHAGKLLNPENYKTLLHGVAKVDNKSIHAELDDMLAKGFLNQDQYNKAVTSIEQQRKVDAKISPEVTGESNRIAIGDKIREKERLQKLLETADESYHPEIEQKIENIKKDIVQLSTKELTPHEKLVNDFGKVDTNQMGVMGVGFRDQPEELLKFIQEQATGLTGKRSEGNTDSPAKPAYHEAVKSVGQELTDRAIAALPESEKNFIKERWKEQGIIVPDGLQKAMGIEPEPAAAKSYMELEPHVQNAYKEVSPVLQRVNNAEYINEKELDNAADHLYDVLDRVDKSGLSEEAKQSSANLIEPLIQKLEGYEFRTKTQTRTVTETETTTVPRKVVKREVKPVLEQSAGTAAAIRTPDGNTHEGTLNIRGGQYVVDVPQGDQIVIGEKAITDKNMTLPSEQEMDNPISFDQDGNVAAVTFKTKDGNMVTIKDPEKALDLAIQLRADMVGEVPQPEFDYVVNEIQRDIKEEVPVHDLSSKEPVSEQPIKESEPNADAPTDTKQDVPPPAPPPVTDKNTPPAPPSTEAKIAPEPDEKRMTTIINRKVDQERQAMGMKPIVKDLRRSWGKVFDEVLDEVDKNPNYLKDLTDSILKNKVPITDKTEASLLYHKALIEDEKYDTIKRLTEARRTGNHADEVSAITSLNRITQEIHLNNLATRKSGSVSGRALRMRQAMLNDEYSLSSQQALFDAAYFGEKIPDQVQAVLDIKASEIKDLQERISQLENQQKDRTTQQAVRDAAKTTDTGVPQPAKPRATKEVANKIRNIAESIRKADITGSGGGAAMSDITAIPRYVIAKALDGIALGIEKGGDLADLIGRAVREIRSQHKDVSEDDIHRYIGGLITKEVIDPATGQSHDSILKKVAASFNDADIEKAHVDIKELVKSYAGNGINDAKIIVNDIYEKLKDAVPGLEKEDIRDAIVSSSNKYTKSALTNRMNEIKTQMRLIKKIEDAEKGNRPKSAGDRAKQSETVQNLKEQWKQKMDDLGITADKSIESSKARLQSELEKVQEKIKSGDYDKEPKKTPHTNPELESLREKIAKERRNLDNLRLQKEYDNMPTNKKIFEYVDQGLRATAVGGLNVYGKLTLAATYGQAVVPFEDWVVAPIMRGFLRTVGAGEIVRGAERYNHSSWEAQKAAWGAIANRKIISEVKDMFMKGENDYTIKHFIDERPEKYETFFKYIQYSHGAVKYIPKKAEFEKSFTLRMENSSMRGEDLQDPAVQQKALIGAYDDALRKIFMQDNEISRKWKKLTDMINTETTQGKASKLILAALFPVTRIPVNYVAEQSSYMVGFIKAAVKRMNKSVDQMNPAERDFIIRAMNKNMGGLAMFALGYSLYKNFGGFYNNFKNFDKRTEDDVPFSDIRVEGMKLPLFGDKLPHFLLHHPAIELAQAGSEMRRVLEERAEKQGIDGFDSMGWLEGMMVDGEHTFEEIPFVGTPLDISRQMRYKDKWQKLASYPFRRVIPTGIKDAAKWLDRRDDETIKRRPETFFEEIQMDIPWLRENVPEK